MLFKRKMDLSRAFVIAHLRNTHLFTYFYIRYIRSERSIILINFCLSIICSNILILVGQTQTHNAVNNFPTFSTLSYCLAPFHKLDDLYFLGFIGSFEECR